MDGVNWFFCIQKNYFRYNFLHWLGWQQKKLHKVANTGVLKNLLQRFSSDWTTIPAGQFQISLVKIVDPFKLVLAEEKLLKPKCTQKKWTWDQPFSLRLFSYGSSVTRVTTFVTFGADYEGHNGKHDLARLCFMLCTPSYRKFRGCNEWVTKVDKQNIQKIPKHAKGTTHPCVDCLNQINNSNNLGRNSGHTSTCF